MWQEMTGKEKNMAPWMCCIIPTEKFKIVSIYIYCNENITCTLLRESYFIKQTNRIVLALEI